jgi:hypothetical protein
VAAPGQQQRSAGPGQPQEVQVLQVEVHGCPAIAAAAIEQGGRTSCAAHRPARSTSQVGGPAGGASPCQP